MSEQYITVPAVSTGGTCTSRGWVRNPDWLAMPTTSDGDDIIYILSQVFGDDRPNFMSVYVTVSSGNYTVDLYNDGTTVTNHSSAAQADFDLDYSKGTGEVSEFGYKQVITKITAATGNLTAFDMYRTHADANGGFNQPTLSVKITSQTITSLLYCFRGVSSKSFHRSLEEFEFFGTCNVTNTNNAFTNCTELGRVKGNFEDVTNIGVMFSNAGDIDISELQFPTSSISTGNQIFKNSFIRKITGTDGAALFKGVRYPLSIMENAANLVAFGTSANPVRFDSMDNANGFQQAFQNCSNLKQAYFLEAQTAPKSLRKMFNGCYTLGRVETIDGSQVTDTTSAFNNTRSLAHLRITGLTVSFDISECNMEREALVQVFNDLASASATITITNNPGVGDLTADDLLIATNKGWTVTS